jgi:hypothetical protein
MGEVENGAVTYTANLLGNRPRIMDVCIPTLMDDDSVCDEWNGERQQDMLERFKVLQQGMDNLEDNVGGGGGGGGQHVPNNNNNNADGENAAAAAGEEHISTNSAAAASTNDNHGLMILQNRPPWWNVELGAFVLNFGGRVKVASVKNFQLCERTSTFDQEHIMQFGRIEGRHAFTMDFGWPLTPVQAFAIAISSLQSKISFG